MSDQFKKHFDRIQERKRQSSDVVDPDAPPLPDEPVEQAQAGRTTGRNDPCPCNSGKKFKKCCGKAS
ncbi:MAG: SEC-C domain-containing protein [Phycisphaerales bacterium]|nr:SEC-C domain-containing protein [Phycisphaerales bacterium]